MSKVQPTLSGMPWFIKKNIVEQSSMLTRIDLRNTSKELRFCVDTAETHYEFVGIEIHNDRIVIKHIVSPTERFLKEYRNKNIAQALLAFGKIFKNPNASLDTVFIMGTPFIESSLKTAKCQRYMNTFCEHFENQFSKCKLKVKRFSCYFHLTEDQLLKIVSNLNVESFDSMSLGVHDANQNMERIAALDQWKHAKELDINFGLEGSNFSIKHLSGFEEVDATGVNIDLEDIKLLIKEILEKNNANFKEIFMERTHTDFDALRNYLNTFREGPDNNWIVGTFGTNEYLIADTNEDEGCFQIRKAAMNDPEFSDYYVE